MLLLRERGAMNVTEIAGHLGLAQPTISQHLRILKEAGAIRPTKHAQQVYYEVCDKQVCDVLSDYIKLMSARSDPKTSNARRNNGL